MIRKYACFCLVAWGLLALTGCLTPAERRAKRIEERKDAFTALPAETQQRLRDGNLQFGDTTNAAWFVYGAPSRIYSKTSIAGTNTVWSYISTDYEPSDEFEPVWYQYQDRRGHAYLEPGYLLHHSYIYNYYEYLRLEFEHDKVIYINKLKETP